MEEEFRKRIKHYNGSSIYLRWVEDKVKHARKFRKENGDDLVQYSLRNGIFDVDTLANPYRSVALGSVLMKRGY